MRAENAVPILRELIHDRTLSQRQLADHCRLSLGTVNRVVNRACQLQYLERCEDGLCVTEAGLAWLAPYKVTNAVVLAAGFTARMTPLVMDMPAGLLTVKGEIMIERQIEQLLEVGVDDISMVVGYHMESYDYLVDRYGVKLIFNPQYETLNNFASLQYALDRLDNTYILVADSYFEKNLFNLYEPYPWYSVSYCEGETGDWCVNVTPSGKISDIRMGGRDSLAVIGPVYYDRAMTGHIKQFFQTDLAVEDTSNTYWEARLQEHFNSYAKWANIQTGNVYEFNRIEDVRTYDKAYVNEVRDKISRYYADAWSIPREKISEIKPLRDQVGYPLCKFNIGGHEYALRIPDTNSESFIDAAKVKATYDLLAPLEVTDELLSFDFSTGIRVTRYEEQSSFVDPLNDRDLSDSMQLIRQIHDRKLTIDYRYDIGKMFSHYEKIVYRHGGMPFQDIDEMKVKMHRLLALHKQLEVEEVLCHGDYLYAHVVRKVTGGLFIINWEFAGMGDPLMDVAMFGLYSFFDKARLDLALSLYCGRDPRHDEVLRFYLNVALGSLLWSMWGLQKKRHGFELGEYPLKMYRYMKDYYSLLETMEPSLAERP